MEKWKGTYIDNFLDIIKILPNDFCREFALVGVLDQKAAGKRSDAAARLFCAC